MGKFISVVKYQYDFTRNGLGCVHREDGGDASDYLAAGGGKG